MNTGRNFLLAVIAVLLGIIVVQAARLSQQLRVAQAMQAERDAQLATARAADAMAPDIAGLAGQLHETQSKLLEARDELAATKRQLRETANQMAALERQMQTLARQVSARSAVQSVAFTEDGTGFAADTQAAAARGRPWGEEQVVGAPDTHQAGDISTAWASKQPDAGEEWLKLDYANMVSLAEVRVRETYSPGAISRIAAVLPNGGESTLWEGVAEPAPAPAHTVFRVPANVVAASVKIYLDTRRVRGWNEIDAVELIGRDGSRQWAEQATASSSYADSR